MASGHVNRTQRPNTWLHRPSLRREDSPCQLGAVHTWPRASTKPPRRNFRSWGLSGCNADIGFSVAIDPSAKSVTMLYPEPGGGHALDLCQRA